MKRSIAKAALAGFAFVGAVTAYAKAKPQPPKNVVPIEKAKATATAAMAGQIQDVQLEREDGKWVYSFDLKSTDAKTHEVQVDAISGKLVNTKAEADDDSLETEETDGD